MRYIDSATNVFTGMGQDVAHYVASCEACARTNPNNCPEPSVLHPIKVKHLFHRWGLDLIGPIKESQSGNKYLAVAIEYLSNWPEVRPIKSKSAEEVAQFFVSIIHRFGAMECIIHDQGKEFMNKVVAGICAQFDVHENVTAAYHPQVCYRFFNTVLCLCSLLQRDFHLLDEWQV